MPSNAGYAFLGLKNYSQAIANFSDALALFQEINAPVKSLDPMVGLARTYMEQQQMVQAMEYVERILDEATTGQLNKSESASLIYLTCYRVLKASQDPRAAGMLDTAYRQLQERAAKITNEKLHRSFLENISTHREIAQEWQTTHNSLQKY